MSAVAGDIVVRLMGGLANQIFQYAAGRAIASARGCRLRLDLSHFSDPGEFRRFALDAYAFNAGIFPWPTKVRWDRRVVTAALTGRELRALARSSPLRAVRRLLSPDSWRERPLVAEAGFDFDPAVAAAPPGSYLLGYFQSERYFAAIAEEMRATFRAPRIVDATNRDWLARIAAAHAVAVHVRRGDYLNPVTAARHGVCSAGYFRAAIATMRARVPGATFFAFSEDRDWVRETLAAPDLVVVDANGPDAAAQELMLMAACRHHVIANSSLSWWGAWLAAAPGQLVIAPTPWFGEPTPTPDLLPRQWMTLARE